MSLNSADNLDSLESSKISEKIIENSEQYQEKARKTQSQLKKIQKDENQAKQDNQKLFLILSRFISDEYYSDLISDVSSLLQASIPSRWIISFIALFYPDATYFLADSLGNKEKINLLLSLPKNENLEIFDEKKIHPNIQKWITEWISLMEKFLIQDNSSILMTKKFLTDISTDKKILIHNILSRFLIFFFKTRNVIISEEKSLEYAGFIQKNLINLLQKYIETQQEIVNSLLEDISLSSDDLFRS